MGDDLCHHSIASCLSIAVVIFQRDGLPISNRSARDRLVMLDGQFTRLLIGRPHRRRVDAPVADLACRHAGLPIPVSDRRRSAGGLHPRTVGQSRAVILLSPRIPPRANRSCLLPSHQIDYRNQRAECGIFWNGETTGGEIAAFEAGFLIRDYAYSYLNLQKMSRRNCFRTTCARSVSNGSRLRDDARGRRAGCHLYYDGQFHDLSLYAQFRDDFYDRPTRVVQMFLAAKSRKQHPGL